MRTHALTRLARAVTLFLIFVAGIGVQGWFWWRSMPAHDWDLTLVWCGVPLLVCLGTGWVSWLSLRHANAERRWWPFRTNWQRPVGWAAVVLAVTAVGWFRAGGALEYFARQTGYYDWALAQEEARLAQAERYLPLSKAVTIVADKWWMQGYVVPAQLVTVNFVKTPPDWPDRDTFAAAFRANWCRARGLEPLLCDSEVERLGEGTNIENPEHRHIIADQRSKWCKNNFTVSDAVSEERCAAYFAELELAFQSAWQRARRQAISSLQPLRVAGLDLRKADLRGAGFEGAVLPQARLEGADLLLARLEGATLSWARLEGATLVGAGLEGAKLSNAQLIGADLSFARLNDADLTHARLENADLSDAWLEGVLLDNSSFGANTILRDATLRGAALRDVNLAMLAISQRQIDETFGDASVILPKGHKGLDGLTRPAHWATEAVHRGAFLSQWRAWQKSIGYAPPN